jgi:hypothetical protein
MHRATRSNSGAGNGGAGEIADESLEGECPSFVQLPKTRVLVVGTHDWAIEQAADAIEAAGSSVLRCHEPGQPTFPCNALIEGRTCPLDAGFDVVATVRARPLGTLAQSEFGVICALHHGMPLVVAGVAPERPLGPWAVEQVEQGGDLASACERAAFGAEPELAVDSV